VLGRPLRFEAQPDDEARTEMSAAMPAEYVDAFFRFYVDGELDESMVLPVVPDLVGRPADLRAVGTRSRHRVRLTVLTGRWR
jgi:hypothetical protein